MRFEIFFHNLSLTFRNIPETGDTYFAMLSNDLMKGPPIWFWRIYIFLVWSGLWLNIWFLQESLFDFWWMKKDSCKWSQNRDDQSSQNKLSLMVEYSKHVNNQGKGHLFYVFINDRRFIYILYELQNMKNVWKFIYVRSHWMRTTEYELCVIFQLYLSRMSMKSSVLPWKGFEKSSFVWGFR